MVCELTGTVGGVAVIGAPDESIEAIKVGSTTLLWPMGGRSVSRTG